MTSKCPRCGKDCSLKSYGEERPQLYRECVALRLGLTRTAAVEAGVYKGDK